MLEKAKRKMETRLYVGNLSRSTTQDELAKLFAQAGEVASVEVIMDYKTGESKGFAFVTMRTQSEADQAIRMFNLQLLSNRTMSICLALSSENRDVMVRRIEA